MCWVDDCHGCVALRFALPRIESRWHGMFADERDNLMSLQKRRVGQNALVDVPVARA
jgi:hypothetical protein